MTTRLRPETEADLPFLLSVYASTREAEMAVVPWTQEQKDAFVQQQFAAQRKHYQEHYAESQFDIVMVDDVPVGRLYVFRGPREIRIVDISLLASFRGQGIGRALLEGLQAEAREGGKILGIHVERYNPALRLYERLGFRTAGEEGPVYLYMEYNGR
jgi:ribosomal protein S18 acetylase RimI-like enzyme